MATTGIIGAIIATEPGFAFTTTDRSLLIGPFVFGGVSLPHRVGAEGPRLASRAQRQQLPAGLQNCLRSGVLAGVLARQVI